MSLRRFVAACTFALLLPAFFVLPSCSDPSCADGGEGCPCEKATDCGDFPFCTGWMCDGTCHRFNERVGFRCRIEPCASDAKCPGVCDGAGTCIGCLVDADCKPGHTCEPGNVCSRCDDGVKNGDETDVDCGGSCPLCPGTCNVDADCPGGYCWERLCVRCDDGIQNGDESGVDCGSLLGHCPVCTGYKCETDEQCATGICAASGVCCKVVCDGCKQCEVDGECVQVAGPIPWAGCLFGQICGLAGTCAWKDGYPCTKNEDCLHLSCVNGICD